jgi:biotin carboxylase
MLLDAGFASLPLQQAIKAAGFHTLVCSGKAQDAGMLTADEVCIQNYADSDAVLALARKHHIRALAPGVTDVSYLTGSRVAGELGLPGFDTPEVSEIIFLKDRFRAWAQRQGYPIPQAAHSLQAARALPCPLLVKPVDAYSGIGVTRIDDHAQLDAAVALARSASPGGQCVIETFCEGTLHSHSAFIRNGQIVCEFFVDEFCTVYPWQVNSSCLSQALADGLRDQLSECLQSVVSDLRLVDGLLHTQFIARDNQFWLIELTRRCPGDLYSRLIEYSTAEAYCAGFVAPFIGDTVTFSARRPVQRRAIARHTVSSSQPARYGGLRFAPLPATVIETIALKLPGEPLRPAPADRAGLVFAEFSELATLAEMTPQLKNIFSFHSL